MTLNVDNAHALADRITTICSGHSFSDVLSALALAASEVVTQETPQADEARAGAAGYCVLFANVVERALASPLQLRAA